MKLLHKVMWLLHDPESLREGAAARRVSRAFPTETPLPSMDHEGTEV